MDNYAESKVSKRDLWSRDANINIVVQVRQDESSGPGLVRSTW